MKTMTCKQMGGACDAAFSGNTADEVMNKGAEHLTAMKDEPAHKASFEMMIKAQTDPKLAEEWGTKFHADFAALPDDA
jgi:predicted small metal-binding protein